MPSKQSIHMMRVKQMPCIVCQNLVLSQTSNTDVHHIKRDPATGQKLGASQKSSDFDVIPLCSGTHHWNGVNVGMGSKVFERDFGNELDLLRQVNAILRAEDEI